MSLQNLQSSGRFRSLNNTFWVMNRIKLPLLSFQLIEFACMKEEVARYISQLQEYVETKTKALKSPQHFCLITKSVKFIEIFEI